MPLCVDAKNINLEEFVSGVLLLLDLMLEAIVLLNITPMDTGKLVCTDSISSKDH